MASILLASQGQLTIACGLIFLAAVFDVFDGLAARALGGGTPLGAQLDSLADMVSFGVAPGMLVFAQSLITKGPIGAIEGYTVYPPLSAVAHRAFDHERFDLLIVAAMVIVVASCWRLAKFNIDTRQTVGFLGLPTPANALFWASAVLLANGKTWWLWEDLQYSFAADLMERVNMIFYDTQDVLIVATVLGALMLSELPLPSLKIKHKGWKDNEVIFLLIGIGAVLVLLYGVLAVPLILIIYLLSPLWGKLFPKHPA